MSKEINPKERNVKHIIQVSRGAALLCLLALVIPGPSQQAYGFGLGIQLTQPKQADPINPETVGVEADPDNVQTVKLGEKCIVGVKTKARKVTWEIPTGVQTVSLDGKRLAVWAQPGTYIFTAMVPSGDDVAHVRIVLTVTAAQPPPAPVPGPTPPAPVPPGPIPPVPTPVDPYTAALQAAYNKATDPDKANKLDLMVFFIKEVLQPSNTNLKSALDTPTTTTTTALLAVLKQMRESTGLKEGSIEPVGSLIEDELVRQVFGVEPGKPLPQANLDQPVNLRARFRDFFTKTYNALIKVQK